VGWRKVAKADDVPEDEGFCVSVDGRNIALFKVEGEIYAIDDTCSHAQAQLSMGFVDGSIVECPLHQACFDVRTGKVMNGPATEDVASFPTRVEDGAVFLDV
jgi:naphthalene 1,2-dioxygenase system ferredoxin subunit